MLVPRALPHVIGWATWTPGTVRPATMSEFRHLNVDQYDEETFSAEELAPQDPRSDEELSQVAHAKQSDVRARLSSGDMAGALHVVLADPPTGHHAVHARETTLSMVLDILNSTRTVDIMPAVKALDASERDTLMKYLYRGMERGRSAASVNCAVLLSWHEKLTLVAGTGSIMRVMTDRRMV